MGNILTIAVFLCSLTFYCFQQIQDRTSGLYLINSKDNCPNKIRLLNESREYCVSAKPIVEIQSFKSVSPVKTAYGLIKFMNIEIEKEASRKLEKIGFGLDDMEVGLIIDNELVSIIELRKNANYGNIKLTQGDKSKEIDRIREKIISELNQLRATNN